MKARTRWLDRRIAAPGPFLALCLSEQEYRDAMRNLQVEPGEWIKNPHSHATAHTLEGPRGLTVVVCLREWQGRNPVEVAGLLIHEAVHAWQHYADRIGEDRPGDEQEAYAIQSIAQELLAEFARRVAEDQAAG